MTLPSGKNEAEAQTALLSLALKKGIPRKSVGSSSESRRSIKPIFRSLAICATIEDFPIPGDPHKKTGIFHWLKCSIERLVFCGYMVTP